MTDVIGVGENPRAGKELRIIYRNWRDEIRERRVWPIKVWRGSTEWHPSEQWLLQATDEESGEIRDFAMRDIIRIDDNPTPPTEI